MSLDDNLSGVNNGRWTKPMAIGLEARESMRKHDTEVTQGERKCRTMY